MKSAERALPLDCGLSMVANLYVGPTEDSYCSSDLQNIGAFSLVLPLLPQTDQTLDFDGYLQHFFFLQNSRSVSKHC